MKKVGNILIMLFVSMSLKATQYFQDTEADTWWNSLWEVAKKWSLRMAALCILIGLGYGIYNAANNKPNNDLVIKILIWGALISGAVGIVSLILGSSATN